LATSERVFRREYCSEPQAGALSAFDADAVDQAFRHPMPTGIQGSVHIIVDPSSGKKDAFSYGACAWVSPPKGETWKPYLRFFSLDGFEGSFCAHVDGDKIADRIAEVAKAWGATTVHADQREEFMLRSAFAKRKLSYLVHPWTAASKPEAVERVRRWLASRTLALPPGHQRVRSELLSFEEKITPSGSFTFGARGNGHDDYVSLLITAAMSELAGSLVLNSSLPHSVVRRDPSRYDGLDGHRGTRFGGGRGF